jgi:hypothetical protein
MVTCTNVLERAALESEAFAPFAAKQQVTASTSESCVEL